MYAQIVPCTTYRLSKDRRLRELCRTVGCACVAHNQIQWSRRFQESLRVQSAFDVMKNPVVRGLQKKRALELGFHCAMPDDDAMLFKKFKKSKIKNQPPLLSIQFSAFRCTARTLNSSYEYVCYYHVLRTCPTRTHHSIFMCRVRVYSDQMFNPNTNSSNFHLSHVLMRYTRLAKLPSAFISTSQFLKD